MICLKITQFNSFHPKEAFHIETSYSFDSQRNSNDWFLHGT